MTGEEQAWVEMAAAGNEGGAAVGGRLAPQPGRRSPAPGELSTVQSFINSHFDLVGEWGTDLFHTPAGLRDWCMREGLISWRTDRLRDVDVEQAIAVREGLRALAAISGEEGGVDADRLGTLDATAAGLPMRLSFAAPGAQLVPAVEEPLARALATVLSIAYRAIVDGSWERLKICPGEHCGWAFYDHSRNKSGRWCSMSVCGGRAKARSYYRRARDG
jgi:predicted RNA-binding Zn ribbon-like protein